MTSEQKFREIEHSADIAIEVYGKDLSELFENALEGLLFLSLQNREKSEDSREKKIELEASSPEELLVDFLNEIIFLINVEDTVPVDGRVSVKDNKLEAKLEIQKEGTQDNIKQEIKAATYHKLDLKRTGGEFKIEVFFDT